MPVTPKTVDTQTPVQSSRLAGIRRLLRRLAEESSPQRTAAGLALGVFLSFSPFLGLQILLGIGLAGIFRLSRLAVLIGLCANLPWIMVPWYVATTATAATIIGGSITVDLGARFTDLFALPVYRFAFWSRAVEVIGAVLWPFLIGSSAGALVLATAAYAIALRVLRRRESTTLPGLASDTQQGTADRHVHDAKGASLQPQEQGEQPVDGRGRQDDVGSSFFGGGDSHQALTGPDDEHQREEGSVRVGEADDVEAGARQESPQPAARRSAHLRSEH